MKLEMKENAGNKLWIPIVVMILFFVLLAIFSSCSVQQTTPNYDTGGQIECLTELFYGDGYITSIDTSNGLVLRNWKFKIEPKVTVYTTNHLGHEIPHYVHWSDSSNYEVGKPMIFDRR